MANYILQNTADEIDTALNKVSNLKTSLTNVPVTDPSLVTSGAVKSYVDGLVTPAQTSATGLTDSDSFVPTSAAVKDYVEGTALNASPGHSRLSVNGNSNDGYYSRTSSGYIPFGNIPFSVGQIVSLSSNGNTMSFPKGTYLVEANIDVNAVSYNKPWRYQLRHDGNTRMQSADINSTYSNPSGDDFNCKIFVSSTSTQHVQLYAEELVGGGTLRTGASTYITVTRLYD
tara:strand:- start:81 stop:767 length:687 start_codon:yes stop_codon:yes gene_type:complete